MLVLGIETSCDETAASVVKDGYYVLSNVVSSSQDLYQKYGGIVPEIASRHQVEKINFAIDVAIKDADIKVEDIDLIAVTRGPGLIGSLLTGVTAGKWMGFVLGKPVIGINHLQAHLFSSLLERKNYSFPALGLVVSGGHTCLVYIRNYLSFSLLGSTIDDAAGEAFDKVAKLLELGYPGGPFIEELAKSGNSEKINFPVGLRKELNFSFSGLKTAVLYYVRDNFDLPLGKEIRKRPNLAFNGQIADICASFQNAIITTLIEKTKKTLREFHNLKFLFTGGGVIANKDLREKLLLLGKEFNVEVLFPERNYCTDNAAMVAGLGFHQYWKMKNKNFDRISSLDFEAVPDLRVDIV